MVEIHEVGHGEGGADIDVNAYHCMMPTWDACNKVHGRYQASLCLQATFTSIICATLFLRTHISPDGIDNAHLYASFLFFATLQMFFNGIAEMTLTVSNACVI